MRVAFIDRDGTLIEEPPDEQIDRLDKLRLVDGVIPALLALRAADYRFVMVSNQDGLGSPEFPAEDFQQPQTFLLELLRSQGIEFDAVRVCPHRSQDACACRKPGKALIEDYLGRDDIDVARSVVIGDRDCDMQLARNAGLQGLQLGNGLDWSAIVQEVLARERVVRLHRKTNETDIEVSVALDAPGTVSVTTGIGFFDHMLEQLAFHAGISLQLSCRGDLHIDEHHTVEDCALALGEALGAALGARAGIGRYGFLLPMDESLAEVAVDLSGRPWCSFEAAFARQQVGGLPTEMVPHFFRSLAQSLGASIHITLRGENTHHMIEAAFKGLGRALRPALAREGQRVPSTKGQL